MKNYVQMIFSKTFLTLALTVVLCVSFASSLFAVVGDAGIVPVLQSTAEISLEVTEVAVVESVESAEVPVEVEAPIEAATVTAVEHVDVVDVPVEAVVAPIVPTGQNVIPLTSTISVDYAPSVSHTTVGGDPDLKFPYRLNLVGDGATTSFNLYIVDTLTREVITNLDHIGSFLFGEGTPTIQTSARGNFIQLTTAEPVINMGLGGNRMTAQLVVMLAHGQEVVITTSNSLSTDSAIEGFVNFSVLSFFWPDGPPDGFIPAHANPGPPDEFGADHKQYTFHLNNPDPRFAHIPGVPPVNFHDAMGSVLAPYAEGFFYNSRTGVHALEGSIRVEAVWTFDADPVLPLVKNFEVPEGITLANATFNFIFDAIEVVEVPGAIMPSISVTANFTNLDTVGPPAAAETFVYTIANILLDIDDFTQAGVHVYKVSEAQDTVTGLPADQSINYSQAVFIVEIDVREDAENDNALFIYGITIRAARNDAGEDIYPTVVVPRLSFNNVLELDAEDCPPCTWGEWVITTPPSCCAPGERTRTCSRCGTIQTEPIPRLECTFGDWTVTTYPNCVTPGEETQICTTCIAAGDNCCPPNTRPIPPGCNWGDWTVVTPPTCNTAGTERRDCGKCDEYETRTVPPLGCSWGQWVVTTPPGIGTPGEETRTCSRCGATETRPIPPLTAEDPELCDACEEDPCVCETDTLETTPTVPGNDRDDKRTTPGPKTGDTSNPTMHLLHMLAAALLFVVVAYRLVCTSEFSTKRKTAQVIVG